MEIITLPDILFQSSREAITDCHFYQHVSPQSSYKSKIHFSTHAISFILDGTKVISSADQTMTFTRGTFLLFKTGNYLSTEITHHDCSYRSLLVFFTPELLKELKQKYFSKIKERDANHAERRYVSIASDTFLNNFVASCVSLTGDKFTPILQRLKLEELLVYLLEREGTSVWNFFCDEIPQDSLKIFREVVEKNSYSNLTIEELSFLVNMSPSTFKRVFKKVFGESPGKWLKEKRLDYSAYLLGIKRQNPSEIYEQVGFENLSSFTQSFKKQFGVTPKQYQFHKR